MKMGTGWRRAFCTAIPRDSEIATGSDKQHQGASPSPSPSPRSCTKLGFFTSSSNPSTFRLQSQPVSSPSLRCRTTPLEATSTNESPRFQCKTTPKATKGSKPSLGSNPSSPRSPLKLSLFKNSFKFRSSCGICFNSVKTGQGTAIYTAECSHAFHFPCIASHVRNHGRLVCPVCNTIWKDVPLLAVHKNLNQENVKQNDPDSQENINGKTKIEENKIIESSPTVVKTPKQEPKVVPSALRSYADDEPLLSPTTGTGGFIPIPEVDGNVEEDESDVEEFQGFFVNPNHSSSFKYDQQQQSYSRDSRIVQLKLSPESAVISVGKYYETYAVALRVKAPPTSPSVESNNTVSHRPPIDLVTVLDVSGSMTGAKLQMLKRAMRLVISSLGSADRLSIVGFSAISKRLLPLRRMTAQGQLEALRIIDRLMCSQGTIVGDALRKATKVLDDRRERNPVASIMLLSDGQDERVQVNASQRHRSSHSSSSRFAHIEIPVHSFGFGRSGGYSHEPAEDAFAKCIGGLVSVVQDLRIQLSFASGSAPAEISAVYSCNGQPTVLSSGSLRLGDLYAEEERELLVELRVPTRTVGSHHVMSVKCLYKDPATQEVVYGADQHLPVPCPHDLRSSSPKIERLRSLFITTRAIAESRRLIEHNDFTSAHHLLVSARALLVHSSSESAGDYLRSLKVELGELHWRRQYLFEQEQQQTMLHRRRVNEREVMIETDEDGEPLTPTSAWRAAEKLAKVAMMKKSLNRISDLHGFENARF